MSYSHVVPDGAGDTRIGAQVVSGIGFLGAGVIFKEGLNVRGLNTAATLWCSAAVGLLAGEGLALYGLLAAAFVLGANTVLRPIVHAINRQPIEFDRGGAALPHRHRLPRGARIRHQVPADSGVRLRARRPFQRSGQHVRRRIPAAVAVTAIVTSHKRRELALETIVARLTARPAASFGQAGESETHSS